MKEKKKKLYSNIFYCFYIITSQPRGFHRKRMEVVFNNSECNIGKRRTIVNFGGAPSQVLYVGPSKGIAKPDAFERKPCCSLIMRAEMNRI